MQGIVPIHNLKTLSLSTGEGEGPTVCSGSERVYEVLSINQNLTCLGNENLPGHTRHCTYCVHVRLLGDVTADNEDLLAEVANMHGVDTPTDDEKSVLDRELLEAFGTDNN